MTLVRLFAVVVEHGDLGGVAEVKARIMLPTEIRGPSFAKVFELVEFSAENPYRMPVHAGY
jgi:hypothetical protein